MQRGAATYKKTDHESLSAMCSLMIKQVPQRSNSCTGDVGDESINRSFTTQAIWIAKLWWYWERGEYAKTWSMSVFWVSLGIVRTLNSTVSLWISAALSSARPSVINVGIWPPMLMRGCGIGMRAGIHSLLWPATRFCMINRSVQVSSGGINQGNHQSSIIFNRLWARRFHCAIHTHTSTMATSESRRHLDLPFKSPIRQLHDINYSEWLVDVRAMLRKQKLWKYTQEKAPETLTPAALTKWIEGGFKMWIWRDWTWKIIIGLFIVSSLGPGGAWTGQIVVWKKGNFVCKAYPTRPNALN